ncbi:MAG: tRNA lysidine(34) synthetase TilS [Coriobacteriia bacterium]|nr:tRNA lysidine(34) synthetase TilS [Coriobacteriia bacterium]
MEKVKNTIKNYKLFKDDTPLMLMVSGGSDSVALVKIMQEIHDGPLAIMHLNHMLRDDDSKKDEKFVKNLGLKTFIYRQDLKKINGNVEANGRKLRYRYARKAVKEWGYENAVIATAHTVNDRVENFYMRSIVGTGPGGFTSISYKNRDIVRPLLDCSREELQNYLCNIGQTWRVDKTNNDTDRFRAYVRHKIVPLAIEQNPKLLGTLSNTMNLISDENDYLEKIVEANLNTIDLNNNSCLFKPEFNNLDTVIKRRIIYKVLRHLLPEEERIETKSIKSILQACKINNYTDNIQYNYAVHSNKHGVLVEPMQSYRLKRNRI